jgi:putative ATPase
MEQPLAAKLRPNTLEGYVGQSHLVAPGKPLYEAMQKQHLFSFILWGPPGVGKTTLARIYAKAMGARFFELSAVSSGKADVKAVVDEVCVEPKILFLDEIHRFNKAQQDYLLPFVESGTLTLIGATTENPSFEVIGALLSRCRVFTLKSLTEIEMETIIDRSGLVLDREARDWLIQMAGGDARQALTLLEATSSLYDEVTIATLTEALQNSFLRYDKQGEEHYNTISAFIKSMRASNPDAALYYLARMTEAGEDPKFIARRLVIFASEDVGMAQPTALVIANEVFRAVETIGYPECTINLAHAVVYLATAKKDRRAYDALREAQRDVRNFGNLPIPLSLRNAPTKLMKDEGYGEGYDMYPKAGTSLLPDKLKSKKYFK